MAEINKIIKNARDVLVGKVPDPQSQIDQITLALIYKFMDAKDREARSYDLPATFFVGEYEDYSFTRIMKATSNPEKYKLYSTGIELLQNRTDLPSTFVSVFKDAFIPYRDPQTLNLFLAEIDKIPTDNTELLGTAFEDLLSIMGSQGDAGQFRTPRHIIDMIVEIVNPQKGETILDPACGTAGFLISAYNKISKTYLSVEEREHLMNNGLVGYDINPNMVKLANVNLFLHNCKKPNIHLYDTLSEKTYWKDDYDVILANPPFMTPKGGIRPHELFNAINANRSEVLFTYGVNLICIEEGIDSSQTSGKLLISVLSAVAEIERENILEQTMNGRREKARQGKWNGGPAPYGYILKDDTLLIDEQEAEIVRTIFDKFVNTNMGYTGIAKYLNLQGIKKTPRKKTDIEEFSAHFIKILLDNPVYCGKIAYGRRTREKVKGTKADYKVVNKQDYCLVDGLHEGIIDEELWYKAHDKREATGVKSVSKYGKDRAHLLTGIIKCPKCGSGMYANRVCWTKKDGTYKEVMYYACSRNKQERGHYCDYSANLKKTDIEPLVIEFIKDLVQDEHFAIEIKKKIGLQVDTTKIDTEISNYESKLKEVELNKARLEREIDSLPIDTTHRERKLHDMTLRLDALYDTIAEIEEKVEDAKLRRKSVEAEFITMENIYKILQHFGELYDIISDEEKKELIATLVKEIQIYPEEESDTPLKSMKFNFPVYKDGQEVNEIFLDKQTNVETLVLLRRRGAES